ncbi:uncharacterized protein LOC110623899 [Manihot esculenta]|uniref:uncharacterized protein LOC110623899 n=1 Tax=Manihot esculenta TaxID=3983 RepID=UPI000B5D5399|nr:uncharacterized protein LOC110623899 [Manihot esculenta]
MEYDSYSNTYNPSWRDHPNFWYGTTPKQFQPRASQTQATPPSKPGMSLEDTVTSLTINTHQFQQEVKASIQNLENQMSQLATFLSQIKSQGKLPSQTVVNPRQNVSAITMCNGKEIQDVHSPTRRGHNRKTESGLAKSKKGKKEKGQATINPPFPERFAKPKKDKDEKELLETFCKVEVNIPLLDAIKRVSHYAKFLKDLCTNKRKLARHERIRVGENVSAVLQRKLPPKYKDQGIFAISYKIGNVGIHRAMCDLGTSINVMPLSTYNSLNASPLKKTGLILQLVDRSVVHPECVLEDILVEVSEIVFLLIFMF